MKFQHLLEKVKEHVLSYFETHYDPQLIYHTVKHTKDVVTDATLIANHYQLTDEDFFAVITAAWFHDTGYITDRANHEVSGAEMATEFLKKNEVSDEVIEKVTGCIMATEMPQNPTGLLQQILCDADLFHLGTEGFTDKSKLMRKEMEVLKGVEIDKQHWREKNIELLEAHHYFTDYAQLLLNDQKAKNLKKLKSKQESEIKETVIEVQPIAATATTSDAPKPAKKSKKKNRTRELRPCSVSHPATIKS